MPRHPTFPVEDHGAGPPGAEVSATLDSTLQQPARCEGLTLLGETALPIGSDAG